MKDWQNIRKVAQTSKKTNNVNAQMKLQTNT